jgi:hypothetical protein
MWQSRPAGVSQSELKFPAVVSHVLSPFPAPDLSVVQQAARTELKISLTVVSATSKPLEKNFKLVTSGTMSSSILYYYHE